MWLMPDTGLIDALDQLLQGPYASAQVLLFTSSHEPVAGDDLATYEGIEASWTGYARQSPAPWDAALLSDDGRSFAYSSLLSFPCTAVDPGTFVWGYAVVLDPVLLWAEQLVVMPVPTAGVPVTLRVRVFLGNPTTP